jgi:hypothetical protein
MCGGSAWRLLAIAAIITAMAITTAVPAYASPNELPDVTEGITGPVTSASPGGGTVYASLQVGDYTYVGGDFTTAGGVARPNLVRLRADGTVDPTWTPAPDGIVYALAANADGSRLFLGGTFTTVAGEPRARLAAVDTVTGAAVPGWTEDANDTVFALGTFGDRLYVGGRYTALGDTTRKRLGAVRMSDSTPINLFTPRPNWTVKGVAASPDGTKVYAVGGFDTIGGASRDGAAEVNASDGTATSFNPTETGFTIAMALSPDGSRFFFSTSNNRTYAYDPAVSNTPRYTVQTSGDVQAIAVSNSGEVYIGGHFSQLNAFKLKRDRLASFQYADGVPTGWNPGISNSYMGVWTITATPATLVIGGDFQRVNNQVRRAVARFSGGTI